MSDQLIIEMAKILTDCYVRLNQLHAQPGEKCHMLANSIKFIEKAMKPVFCPQIFITTNLRGEVHGR